MLLSSCRSYWLQIFRFKSLWDLYHYFCDVFLLSFLCSVRFRLCWSVRSIITFFALWIWRNWLSSSSARCWVCLILLAWAHTKLRRISCLFEIMRICSLLMFVWWSIKVIIRFCYFMLWTIWAYFVLAQPSRNYRIIRKRSWNFIIIWNWIRNIVVLSLWTLCLLSFTQIMPTKWRSLLHFSSRRVRTRIIIWFRIFFSHNWRHSKVLIIFWSAWYFLWVVNCCSLLFHVWYYLLLLRRFEL